MGGRELHRCHLIGGSTVVASKSDWETATSDPGQVQQVALRPRLLYRLNYSAEAHNTCQHTLLYIIRGGETTSEAKLCNGGYER